MRTLNERTAAVVIRYGTDEVVWVEGNAPVPPDPPTPPDPEPPPASDLEQRVARLERWAGSFS